MELDDLLDSPAPSLTGPTQTQNGATWSEDQARTASANCPHCDGIGVATVWRKENAAWPEGAIGKHAIRNRNPPATIAMACVCPLGRWMYARRKDHPIRDLAAFLDQVETRGTHFERLARETPGFNTKITPAQMLRQMLKSARDEVAAG